MESTARNSNSGIKCATRNSLSCAPCRYKHLRCDGRKPICTRCAGEKKQCTWPLSRRRGKSKTNVVSIPTASAVYESSIDPSLDNVLKASNPYSTLSITANGGTETSISIDFRFLGLYYKFFHGSHPCVLPLRALKQRLTETATQLLLQVMCYIGSIYDSSGPSESWNQRVEHALAGIRMNNSSITGFDVQAVTLYSIAVYWRNEPDRGTELLDEAICMGLALGMNRKEFTKIYGSGDSLLEESWRRTWWVLYINDAHMSWSTHRFPFRTSGIEKTMDLPCEEDEYEKDAIPPPKSLEDYENREFLGEDETNFSSYTELVGLTLAIDRVITSGETLGAQKYNVMASRADTSIWGWYSLLPPAKRALIRADGSVDEIMFKSLFIMHTYFVEVHRPLSALAYSAIESVSHCAPLPPSDELKFNNTIEREVHTARCIKAIDTIDEFLTLPTNIKTHSPFIICMIADLTIAHLSACRYVYTGERLTKRREKIRLTMGTLKNLSEHWAFAKRIYREIGIIARELLSLAKDTPTPSTTVDMSSIDLTALGILPDADFDFCAIFDSGTASLSEPSS